MIETLQMLIGKLPPVLGGVGLVAGAVIALVIINRVLQRNSQDATGSKFRNQLIMLGASFIGVLMVILALPVSSDTQSQLLTLVGIITSATIALSSTTLLGNAMAGIMLKSVRNFRSGDFIQVQDHFGRVSERGLFHTEIQTLDRDLITLPNLFLTTHPVRVIRKSGTIISATVSLGFEVPRGRIEKLLLRAAGEVGLQEPFVQVLDLGNFSVTYRVAGLLTETKQLVAYKSRLKGAMLDALHTGGVEIVSPAFVNTKALDRDRQIIPNPTQPVFSPGADAAPVEVVFDKAEDAASLSSLRQQRDQLKEEIKVSRQAAKDADDGQEQELIRQRIERLESLLQHVDTLINEQAAKETE